MLELVELGQKTQGIIVCGLNGSGKTTLGRALAKVLNFKFIDIEDYHFHESAIAYSNPRTKEEALALMLADIKKYTSFVICTVNGAYLGEEILSKCNVVTYLTAPQKDRIKRVEQRLYDQFGERIHVGGDMYEQESKFLQYVAARSEAPIEEWLKTIEYPIIPIDGMEDYKKNAVKIAQLYKEYIDSEL